jgi:hypothetical protein
MHGENRPQVGVGLALELAVALVGVELNVRLLFISRQTAPPTA